MIDVNSHIKALNKQLYPTGRAWGYVHGSDQMNSGVYNFVDSFGNQFVDGFGNAFIQTFTTTSSPSKQFINAMLKSFERFYIDHQSLMNQIIADNDEFDITDAGNWERIFGLVNSGLTLDQRKSNILRRQSYPSGIAERGNYLLIQDELQKAGFDVYVTENRFWNGSGFEVNNSLGVGYSICANHIEDELDNSIYSTSEMGVAEMGVAEMNGSGVIATETELRSTFFIGGSVFQSFVNIPLIRKNEFRHLILRLKPCQTIAFLYVNYI